MWVADETGLAGGGFTEKIWGHGEDAEPTYLHRISSTAAVDGAPDDPTLVAVYDGLGGSGARKVVAGVTEQSQAYVGSRSVRDIVESWFVESVENDVNRDVVELHGRIRTRLLEIERIFASGEAGEQTAPSRVKSKMQRSFPTTMAALEIDPAEQAGVHRVRAIWVGDSRCYAWTASRGLQQLSADHTRDSDVLQQLVNDGPMNNVVSAADDWFIDTHEEVFDEPFLAMCASDGVHGYVRTPGMVEFHLLDLLTRATDLASWIAAVTQTILGYTADDATFVLAGFGFDDFGHLQRTVIDTNRLARLASSQSAPFATIDSSESDLVRMAQERSWETYRSDYTARQPARAAARVAETALAPVLVASSKGEADDVNAVSEPLVGPSKSDRST